MVAAAAAAAAVSRRKATASTRWTMLNRLSDGCELLKAERGRRRRRVRRLLRRCVHGFLVARRSCVYRVVARAAVRAAFALCSLRH